MGKSQDHLNVKKSLFKFNFFNNPEDKKVEYVILNTCSFLSSARAEAEDMMEYLDTI
ncbi:MAG: hypothetical protein LBD88_04745 [Candidatus Peribacteria bacterium]|nr:hypothetical protein [Candidatus Peribacteria bacterium]